MLKILQFFPHLLIEKDEFFIYKKKRKEILPAEQCTTMGPSCPKPSLVLCTCPIKSIKPSPTFGTPCSGHSV